MAGSKIDFSFENLHFSCEGENDWVEKQLNSVLSRIPSLLASPRVGESIVEEVIEVKAEAGDDAPAAPEASGAKPAKVRKPRATKEKAVKPEVEPEAVSPVEPKVRKKRVAKGTEGVEAKPAKKAKAAKKPGRKKKVVKAKKSAKKVTGEAIDSPLSQFLADKKAATNQVRKFLATAVFLSRSNQVTRLSTPMISKALKLYGLEKLQNASDCLNKNVKKGYCLKEDKEFSITDNGFLAIE
ncbi:MAG: hypothetical protein LWW85_12745 [Marinilabiliales bacterium]|nr:hypothetical protein [Marinilabiliales bacterium]